MRSPPKILVAATMTWLNFNNSKVVFHKGVLVGPFFVIVAVMACFIRSSYAQPGIGVGIVYAGPHAGGLSVRHKAVQVLVPGIRSDNGDLHIDVAVRYDHSVRGWKRVRFKVFGQVGRISIREEAGLASRFRFTGGGSAELQIVGKSFRKGLFLTLDIGLSMDHLGKLGNAAARGVGIHVFF